MSGDPGVVLLLRVHWIVLGCCASHAGIFLAAWAIQKWRERHTTVKGCDERSK